MRSSSSSTIANTVIGDWFGGAPERVLTRTDPSRRVEHDVVELHDRAWSERCEIGSELLVTHVELDVRGLHVDGVLGEAGQGELRVLLRPGGREALQQRGELGASHATTPQTFIAARA